MARRPQRLPPEHSRKGVEITSLSAIEHLVEFCPEKIRVLILSAETRNSRLTALRDRARVKKIPLDHSGQGKDTEPVRALLQPFEYTNLEAILRLGIKTPTSLVLALDHLQDPQNFGALCRSADAFGVTAILLPKDRCVSVGTGVYQASVGAVETIPIALVGNLGDALRRLKKEDYWIVGTSLEDSTTPPSQLPGFRRIALVLGAEFEGLSPSLRKLCDWQVKLPLKGKVPSLNVSVAGGILMYLLTGNLSLK